MEKKCLPDMTRAVDFDVINHPDFRGLFVGIGSLLE